MRGFIYVLSNPELSGLLKIGKTSKDPKNRLEELYSTGLPVLSKLEYIASCSEAFQLVAHQVLQRMVRLRRGSMPSPSTNK